MPRKRKWRVCAWCEPGVTGPLVTHTICRWHLLVHYPPRWFERAARWLKQRGYA